jgi:hypothetical protein
VPSRSRLTTGSRLNTNLSHPHFRSYPIVDSRRRFPQPVWSFARGYSNHAAVRSQLVTLTLDAIGPTFDELQFFSTQDHNTYVQRAEINLGNAGSAARPQLVSSRSHSVINRRRPVNSCQPSLPSIPDMSVAYLQLSVTASPSSYHLALGTISIGNDTTTYPRARRPRARKAVTTCWEVCDDEHCLLSRLKRNVTPWD